MLLALESKMRTHLIKAIRKQLTCTDRMNRDCARTFVYKEIYCTHDIYTYLSLYLYIGKSAFNHKPPAHISTFRSSIANNESKRETDPPLCLLM